MITAYERLVNSTANVATGHGGHGAAYRPATAAVAPDDDDNPERLGVDVAPNRSPQLLSSPANCEAAKHGEPKKIAAVQKRHKLLKKRRIRDGALASRSSSSDENNNQAASSSSSSSVSSSPLCVGGPVAAAAPGCPAPSAEGRAPAAAAANDSSAASFVSNSPHVGPAAAAALRGMGGPPGQPGSPHDAPPPAAQITAAGAAPPPASSAAALLMPQAHTCTNGSPRQSEAAARMPAQRQQLAAAAVGSVSTTSYVVPPTTMLRHSNSDPHSPSQSQMLQQRQRQRDLLCQRRQQAYHRSASMPLSATARGNDEAEIRARERALRELLCLHHRRASLTAGGLSVGPGGQRQQLRQLQQEARRSSMPLAAFGAAAASSRSPSMPFASSLHSFQQTQAAVVPSVAELRRSSMPLGGAGAAAMNEPEARRRAEVLMAHRHQQLARRNSMAAAASASIRRNSLTAFASAGVGAGAASPHRNDMDAAIMAQQRRLEAAMDLRRNSLVASNTLTAASTGLSGAPGPSPDNNGGLLGGSEADVQQLRRDSLAASANAGQMAATTSQRQQQQLEHAGPAQQRQLELAQSLPADIAAAEETLRRKREQLMAALVMRQRTQQQQAVVAANVEMELRQKQQGIGDDRQGMVGMQQQQRRQTMPHNSMSTAGGMHNHGVSPNGMADQVMLRHRQLQQQQHTVQDRARSMGHGPSSFLGQNQQSQQQHAAASMPLPDTIVGRRDSLLHSSAMASPAPHQQLAEEPMTAEPIAQVTAESMEALLGPVECSTSATAEAGSSSGSASAAKRREDHPTEGISVPTHNDVLLGRGHYANNHTGNRRFRKLLSAYRPRYVSAYKAKKPAVSREVVALWRGLDPPGRFLECTYRPAGKGFEGSIWCDVGDKRAQEKTSQCLREKV